MILWFIKILRLFCAFLDKIAYSLIALVYELFMLISQAGIFSQATIQEFAARIYVFLGLIMVFKVSISLVTYILNPDNFNKADVGAPALLKGFAFSLIGIVLVPYVFEAAYSLQNIVLKDNIIGNLIMGMSDDNNDSDDYIRDAGIDMSFVTLTAFIRLDTQFPQISEACAANPVDVTPAASEGEDPTGTLTAECSGLEEVLGDEGVELLTKAYANRSITYLIDGDLLNVTYKLEDKDEFVMNYLPIISTAAGIFIAYVILLFCIDIAVRSVKLGFLQLIAPIPLIAKIDPKKGNEKFTKWRDQCVSTYFDVFLRLAAIYFVLFIISAITTSGNSGIYNIVTGEGFSGVSGIFVKIFIIIGALNFARDLPKLLGDIFGLKLNSTGGFTLNPMKKIGETPLIGGALGAGAMLGGAGALALGRGVAGTLGSAGSAIANKISGGKYGDTFGSGMKDTGLLMGNRLQAGVSAAGTQINPFTKGEGMRKFYGEGKKNVDKITSLKDGKALLEQAKARTDKLEANDDYKKASAYEQNHMKNKAKSEMFKNEDFKNAFINMNDAKYARDQAASAYEQAKMNYDRGQGSAEEVDNARIAALKASSNFDNRKTDFDTYKNISKKDAETFAAYTYADDLSKSASSFISETSTPVSTAQTTSNVSSRPSVQQTINNTTGVSRPPATSNGAPTADNSRMAEVSREDDFRNNRS